MKKFQFLGEPVNKKKTIALFPISFLELLGLKYVSLIYVHMHLKFNVFIREWKGRINAFEFFHPITIQCCDDFI